MICPNCHSQNRPNARFCDACGEELPSVAFEATEMFGRTAVYEDNGSNISINLEGLEQMIDSSHDPQEFEHASTADLSSGAYRMPEPFEAYETARLGQGEGFASYDPYDPYGADITRALPVRQTPAMTQAIPPVGPTAPARSYADSGRDDHPRGSRKKGLIIGLISALAILAFIGGAYLFQFWGGNVVPDVVGMDREEAIAVLQEAGFDVTVVDIKSDDVEGIVLSTDPEPGKRAEKGSTILVNVSVPRTIPDIVGMTAEEAADLLKAEGFTDIEYADVPSDYPEGTVAGVEPAVGTRSRADSKVIVQVAIPHVVPDVVGMSVEEAKAALEAEGYIVETADVYTEDAPEGQPIGTDPAAGTQLASGSKIVLNLAKNRSKELESLARSYFDAIKTFSINGQDYELRSISSIRYAGEGACAFSIVARPFETHSWFGVEMETRYGNDETINGTITYNDANQVTSIDPAIRQGG